MDTLTATILRPDWSKIAVHVRYIMLFSVVGIELRAVFADFRAALRDSCAVP